MAIRVNKMNKKFRLALSSDLDYEDMVIYINWGNDMLAILDQEKGPDQKDLEILRSSKEDNWKIPFKEFRNSLDAAENFLDESPKLPDEVE